MYVFMWFLQCHDDATHHHVSRGALLFQISGNNHFFLSTCTFKMLCKTDGEARPRLGFIPPPPPEQSESTNFV